MHAFPRRQWRRVSFALATCSFAALCALPAFATALVAQPALQHAQVSAGTLTRSHTRAARLPIQADLVGVTWTGAARSLQLRTRSAGGSWSSWIELDASGDAPDPSSAEGRRASTRQTIGTPVIVDRAQQVQLRADARSHAVPRDVQLEAINVTGTATRSDRISHGISARARQLLRHVSPSADAQTAAPLIHPRTSWGAEQPAGNAGYADRVQGVVVHHTVSTNTYSCASVPALLRGIQRFHIHTNKWFDIGYNFVIDRCGGIWEARGGGITQAVIGAHTAGFNTGTVGIALLGTHSTARPSLAARTALQRLIAWRMDVAHVLPTTKMRLTARSSDKFRLGSLVNVRAVSGHRDLYPTSCPGGAQYTLLTSDAAAAYRLGGLKVGTITSSQNIDPLSGQVHGVVVRAVSTNPAALLRIALERSSTGEILSQLSGHVRVLRLAADLRSRAVPAWDVRVRVTAAMPGQRARTYLEPLVRYSEDPGFTITAPPATETTPGQLLSAGYTLARTAQLSAELWDPATGLRAYQLPVSASHATLPTAEGTLSITIPASVQAGSYDLRIGVLADTAPGRSIRHYALTVQAAAPTTPTA